MKKKINIRFIMIAALAIVVTALSAMLVYYNILKEQVFGDLKAYAHVIELLNIDDLAAGIEKDPYNPIDDDLRITLIGAEGEVLYESLLNKDEMDNHNERPEIIEAREKGEGEAIRYSATSGTHTFYYAERLQNGNVLRIGRDSVSVNRIMVNTLVIVLVIALCILFVCMGISHYLTKKLVEPIEKLATNIMLVDENNVYEEIRPFVNTIKEQHVNIINNAQLRQEFTANVSHELKTPLTAISGYAELIGNGMTGKEDTIRFSNEIHSNANRLLSLINDIIKLSELDEADHQMEMERIDLYKLAENCVQMMQVTAEKQGIRLTLQGESAMAMANKGLMDEVFYNLCSNAIRYNKPCGSVTVTVGTKDERPFLSVADTGIGIPKECQERVFERFYRVDKSRSKSTGGTGLGLAITKALIEMMGGTINVSSQFGKGSIFVVNIPQKVSKFQRPMTEKEIMDTASRLLNNNNNTTKESNTTNIDYGHRKILIVDDNKLNIKVAKRAISDFDFEIDECYDGLECLNKVVVGNEYDLILMDIMMPNMSGETAIKKLKENSNFRIPVIALTADAVSGAKEKYVSEGFVDYIAKPFNKDQIKQKLDIIFNDRNMSNTNKR